MFNKFAAIGIGAAVVGLAAGLAQSYAGQKETETMVDAKIAEAMATPTIVPTTDEVVTEEPTEEG